ncbi:penicillin binding transpeptidase domain protein [Janthinobacterium agaricidamnosum NBRC 102515 = DSM 9628]|uniref:beta-lactamase n=1 Tax=Janthinobacterium agaricidamnosum NBRC 102515 = DSM 9628 TaxID=1349767 RepID=W0V430_9BURK|nr:penicillin binding transpeptidase domain protein [Janthinobacterium agaricidamnosum NBRC 102515 = DSM 9628]
MIRTALHNLARYRRAWRRFGNLRAGAPRIARAPVGLHFPATPMSWLAAAALAGGVAGAVLIAGHARHLEAAAATLPGDARAAIVYQPVLPGATFDVPERPGLSLDLRQGGALLVASGMRFQQAVRVDLCSQLLDPARPRLSPLRLGYRYDDVQRWVARSQASSAPLALRNVLLVAGERQAAMPEIQIGGMALADFSQPLQLDWRSTQGNARWVSDASLGQIVDAPRAQVALRQQGWLLWGDASRQSALRITRRGSAACPQAGELLLQMVHAPQDNEAVKPARALVQAFPAQGQPVAGYLAAGSYQVPAAPRNSLEDQALFNDLQAHGLLRWSAGGGIDLVPRDLALWRAAPAAARAADLGVWDGVPLDQATLKLIKRLYQQADGAYVRQQIDIFNDELRLLAWRFKSGSTAPWSASRHGALATPIPAMPVAASRLFADLPQGWAPWQRVAGWPQGKLRLALAEPAGGAEQFELMLIGRPLAVSGARLHAMPACGGRACPAPDSAQILTLTALPGARAIELDIAALDASTLRGQKDQSYRHLRVAGGKLAWQALDNNGAPNARPRAPSPVLLQDRTGTLLWADGLPTRAASDAGLGPLLGLGSDHGNSVAGMLGRLPLPSTGRLSLDLPLQTLSQRVLDCIGLRRGRWDGKQCSGGQGVPDGRRAGLVFLDAENGDILAAAGAGGAPVSAANWREVRDFDQANPARSPLRLPALQHDGGAHQSPGSTFKIISALGLETAARTDSRIDALLGGLPLAAINGMARQRGFGFQTDAATYPYMPANGKLAHITNYREQSLDRRAQDGRLGLAQALTYSLNTWFAWTAELSDRSLFGRPDGGAPDLQALDPEALDALRPIAAAAHTLGFEQPVRLDGGLLPADFAWAGWDALQATPSHIDTIHTRHELRQMAIGLRMQTTPLQMALASAAIGQGRIVAPRLLLALDGRDSKVPEPRPLDVRLDRIRAGMKGVVETGTGAGAFGGALLAPLRRGLYGKTGTAPSSVTLPDGAKREVNTVWFTGWLEPGSMPGQAHRIAVAAFVSHSDGSGGQHAAPVVAAVLSSLLTQSNEKRGK